MLLKIPDKYCQSPPERAQSQWVGQIDYICHRFHLLVSSAYRTAAENAAAGGAPNSDHLRGDAVDLVGTRGHVAACHDWAEGKFPYVEPMGQAKDHCHISFRHAGKSYEPPLGKHRIKPLGGMAFVRRVWHWSDIFNLDPVAVVAVGYNEGANGQIGDHGISYGPWQLEIGGALPAKWARLGPHSAKTLAWSWSDKGIKYALGSMASHGAAGKRGRAAIHAIVYNFEKPKNKPREEEKSRQSYAEASGAPHGPQKWAAIRFPGPTVPGGDGGGGNGGGGGPPQHVNPGAAGGAWTSFIRSLSRHLPEKRRQLHNLEQQIRREVD